MKKAYQIVAGLIALAVMLQALFIAWTFFGLNDWVTEQGGVLDKAAIDGLEDGSVTYTGSAAFGFHVLNGLMVIPALALVLLILSFFAKVPRGIMFAVVLVVLIFLQMGVLPGLAHDVNPFFGGLHGLNALFILGAAGSAASAAGKAAKADKEPAEVAA